MACSVFHHPKQKGTAIKPATVGRTWTGRSMYCCKLPATITSRLQCVRPRFVRRRTKRFPKKTTVFEKDLLRSFSRPFLRPSPHATVHALPQRDYPQPPQPPQLFTMLAPTLERRRKTQRLQVAMSIAIYGNQYLSTPVCTSIRTDRIFTQNGPLAKHALAGARNGWPPFPYQNGC